MKLQRLFMKLQNNLNNDEFFNESPITMRTLAKELQKHNDLVINSFNIGVIEDEETGSKLKEQDNLSQKSL